MKKTFFLISLLFLAYSTFAQLTADAGPDTHICYYLVAEQEPTFIGGNPSASGGTAPYTYCWHCNPMPLWEDSPYVLYAHNFLDDTTSANPQVDGIVQPTLFYLTVTDAIGNTATDSVWISASTFYSLCMGPIGYHIAQGDSIFVIESGVNISVSGGGNMSCLWQPTCGLSDSTKFGGFWAKPEVSTIYSCIVTDSMGCSETSENCLHIYVDNVGVKSNVKESTFSIYPNPTDNELHIEFFDPDFNGTLYLMDETGKIVMRKSLRQSRDDISLRNLPAGIYVVHVKDKNGNVYQQKLVKR